MFNKIWKRIKELETRIEWMNHTLCEQQIFGMLYHDEPYKPYPNVREVNIPRIEKMVKALLEYHNLEWQVLEERKGYGDKHAERGCLVKKVTEEDDAKI